MKYVGVTLLIPPELPEVSIVSGYTFQSTPKSVGFPLLSLTQTGIIFHSNKVLHKKNGDFAIAFKKAWIFIVRTSTNRNESLERLFNWLENSIIVLSSIP